MRWVIPLLFRSYLLRKTTRTKMFIKKDNDNNDNNNTGNLWIAYPVAQSAEQYRLNTYMYIEIMNVVKKKKEQKIFTYQQNWTTLYRHRQPEREREREREREMHELTHARTHTHTHTHTHAHARVQERTQAPTDRIKKIPVSLLFSNRTKIMFLLHSYTLTTTTTTTTV